eukprot:CAMPEP_0185846966 /NCGR_PEP_ID=MMETSP1354-20130828/2416_1 /TAXON_ID=708628 /ORGANISM="Erythrolobus madagascarensis, Strain CCMP3276" /LENGTH=88 /DNA_ID=CAMNT_0028547201 /DNA_START=293 /DNA_END=559 /DNA_ORIENTATION=+
MLDKFDHNFAENAAAIDSSVSKLQTQLEKLQQAVGKLEKQNQTIQHQHEQKNQADSNIPGAAPESVDHGDAVVITEHEIASVGENDVL